jgi:predicted HTH transcriptional regulator
MSDDSESSTATEVPEVAPSPASDPAPAEAPAMPEPVAEPAQPAETPVIQVPTDPGEIVDTTSHGVKVPPATSAPISIKDRAYAALEKIRFRKRAKLDKILVLAAKKHSIKNDDVEKLLHVSDSTAQRYLNQLVQEGRLKRLGAPKHATYEPV